MRVIIAGSRSLLYPMAIRRAVRLSGFHITEVVSGRARGADKYGEQWADAHGVPVKPFPAQWLLYGREAGHRRNSQMAEYAEALVLVWDGKSYGSADMLWQMVRRRKPYYQIIIT